MASDQIKPVIFAGRELCIATMHGKQQVVAPALEARLGVHCVPVPDGFDTDRFGTFSGEVPRVGTALDAARAKAAAAMTIVGVDLAVASEGSFGPHPDAPMVSMGIELLLLVDRRHQLEIRSEFVTLETNYARQQGESLASALAFGARIGFPTHGVIITVGDPPKRSWRGLRSESAMAKAVVEASELSRRNALPWFVASDMRADQNPTRMRAIERAAGALAERAATPCPCCTRPGFGIVDVVRGLPCNFCGMPSSLPRAFIHGCEHCGERRERTRPDGITAADAGNCSWCNP
jgi:hypothetical protein